MDIKFLCPTCRTELTADDAAAGQSFDCPTCSAKVTVPTGQAEPDPYATIQANAPLGVSPTMSAGPPPPSAASSKGLMQVLINQDGQQLGPYSLEEVNDYLDEGSLSTDDAAWHKGLDEWITLGKVEGVVVPESLTPPTFDQAAFGVSSVPLAASSPPPVAGIPPMAMGAVCPQCNVTVQPSQQVCINCGSHLHALPSPGKKGVLKLIAIIGGGLLVLGLLVAGMLLYPAWSRSKAKQARIKCVNNLSSIGKATLGFSQDNSSRTPWNLIPSQKMNHFGSAGSNSAGAIFGLAAMKGELQSAKILVSPCDAARIADNEILQAEWASINTKGGNPVTSGTSYVFCQGGDFQRPASVVALTRNLSSDNIAAGNWIGADENRVPANAMEGLNKSQGQLVCADGSAKQVTDADLGASGKVVKGHIHARGGTSPLGASSTAVIR